MKNDDLLKSLSSDVKHLKTVVSGLVRRIADQERGERDRRLALHLCVNCGDPGRFPLNKYDDRTHRIETVAWVCCAECDAAFRQISLEEYEDLAIIPNPNVFSIPLDFSHDIRN